MSPPTLFTRQILVQRTFLRHRYSLINTPEVVEILPYTILTYKSIHRSLFSCFSGDAMRLKHVLVHFLSNAIQQTIHPSRPQDAPPIVKIKVLLFIFI